MGRTAEIKTCVTPDLRQKLESLAEQERRTLSSMAELVLIDGIASREQRVAARQNGG